MVNTHISGALQIQQDILDHIPVILMRCLQIKGTKTKKKKEIFG